MQYAYIVVNKEGWTVARLGARAEVVAGPFSSYSIAAHRAEQLAGEHGVYTTLPTSFAQWSSEYAAELGIEELPRWCWLVRDQLTTADVAADLGVSERRVRALASSRNVGQQVSRGTWLFTRRDVEALRDRRPGRPRQSE